MAMINVGEKDITKRKAKAQAVIFLGEDIVKKIKNKEVPKGDVLEAAKVAALFAVKNTPNIIPYCHPLAIEYVKIDYKIGDEKISIYAIVSALAKTGVEMEAIMAVSVAAITIYDMCKMFSKSIQISDIELLEKSGGKSGDYKKS